MNSPGPTTDNSRHTTFTLTADDMIRANLGIIKWRQRQPRQRLLRWGGVAAMVVLGLWMSWPASLLFTGSVILAVAIMSPLIAMALNWIQRIEIKRRVRKSFAQHRSIHQPIDVDWNDDELSFATSASHVRRPWGDHVAWSFDGQVFAVFATDNLYHPIPSHALSAEQVADLTSLMSAAGVPRR